MQVTKHSIEIDPRVIKHLGSDLITSSDVAITELVKNSVDARSKTIDILLYDSVNKIDSDIVPPSIKEIVPEYYLDSPICIISDKGIGMNQSQLHDGFLKVGTTIKAQSQGITLGEKGIGRLAAQRLGPALLVETVSCDDLSNKAYAFIDWEKVIAGKTEALCGTEKEVSGSSYTKLWIFGVDLNDFLDLPHQLALEEDAEFECNKDLRSSLNFLISPFQSRTEKPKIQIEYNGRVINIDFLEKMLSLSESMHYFELDSVGRRLHYGIKITPWFIERIHLAAVKAEAFKRLRKSHDYYEVLLSNNISRIQNVLDRSLEYNELLDRIKKTISALIPCPREALREAYEQLWEKSAKDSLDNLFEISPVNSEIYSYKQNASIGKDIMQEYQISYYDDLKLFFNSIMLLKSQCNAAAETVLANRSINWVCTLLDYNADEDYLKYPLRRVCRLREKYLLFLYKLFLEYRGRIPFNTVNMNRTVSLSMTFFYLDKSTSGNVDVWLNRPNKEIKLDWPWFISGQTVKKILSEMCPGINVKTEEEKYLVEGRSVELLLSDGKSLRLSKKTKTSLTVSIQ